MRKLTDGRCQVVVSLGEPDADDDVIREKPNLTGGVLNRAMCVQTHRSLKYAKARLRIWIMPRKARVQMPVSGV